MILAHDLGTTGDKASLYDDYGRLVVSRTVAYPTDFSVDGRAEQDPAWWWDAVVRASRDLAEACRTRDGTIDCISFSGQMQGAVLLDAAGRPVRPAIIWADTRARAESEALIQRVGEHRAYGITGHRLNPTYTLPKLMWVRQHEPHVWAKVRAVTQAKDFAAYRLTGRLATDPSDASGTDAFDQTSGQWSAELLDAAGIDPALLPEIVPSTTILGGVTAEAAGQAGLTAGTPVVIGGGDGACAALGAGLVSASSGTNVYLGSSAWISLVSERPLHDKALRTMTFNHVVPAQFVPTATMQAGGASLEWVVETLGAAGDSERFDALLVSAAGVEAANNGLFFLPHLLGERSPHWNPRVRGVFVGLARRHGPAHLVRAVLEGVAFNLRTCVLAFEEMGRRIESIDAIGGGARSDVWLQILADVWGKPVRRRQLVGEANGLGAAVVGGVATGMFTSFGIASELSTVDRLFEPNERRSGAYRDRYELFGDAYARLEPWFDLVAQSQDSSAPL